MLIELLTKPTLKLDGLFSFFLILKKDYMKGVKIRRSRQIGHSEYSTLQVKPQPGSKGNILQYRKTQRKKCSKRYGLAKRKVKTIKPPLFSLYFFSFLTPRYSPPQALAASETHVAEALALQEHPDHVPLTES